MLGKHHLRRTAWVAVLAVLLNAFAPLAAHAMLSTRGDAWVDLCTTDGIKRISVADGQVSTDGAPVPGTSGPHCPYCVPHGASLDLAPGAPLAMPVIPGPHAGTAAVDPLPLAPPLRAAHQPRAPPRAR